MHLTTLCYIENQGRYLLMHRNKKTLDENAGVWIGVGGGLEENESPDEGILREIGEETGLHVSNLRLRGILTFILPDWGNQLAFLYTARTEEWDFIPCDEGTLAWIPIEEVSSLPLWEGDRVFLPLLTQRKDCFSLKLVYASGGALLGYTLDGVEHTI